MCREVDAATSSEKSSKSPRVQLPPPAPPLKVPNKVMAPPKRNSARIEKPLPKAITDDDAEIVEVELSDTDSSSSDVINTGSQQPSIVAEKVGNPQTPQPNEDEHQSQVIPSQTTEPKEAPRSEPEIDKSKEANDENEKSQQQEKIGKSEEKHHDSEAKSEKYEAHGGKSRNSDEQTDDDTTSPDETTSSEESYKESYSDSSHYDSSISG